MKQFFGLFGQNNDSSIIWLFSVILVNKQTKHRPGTERS